LPSRLKATDRTQPVCPLRATRSWPVWASHSLIACSTLPEARVLPSGLYATEPEPLRVARSSPLCAAHNLISAGLANSALLALAMVCPSGLKATEETLFVCPLREARSRRLTASHSLIVLSCHYRRPNASVKDRPSASAADLPPGVPPRYSVRS